MGKYIEFCIEKFKLFKHDHITVHFFFSEKAVSIYRSSSHLLENNNHSPDLVFEIIFLSQQIKSSNEYYCLRFLHLKSFTQRLAVTLVNIS